MTEKSITVVLLSNEEKNKELALINYAQHNFADFALNVVVVQTADTDAQYDFANVAQLDVLQSSELTRLNITGAVTVLNHYFAQKPTSFILFADDKYPTSIAVRVAASLQAQLITHVVAVAVDLATVTLTKKVYSGGLQREYEIDKAQNAVLTCDLAGSDNEQTATAPITPNIQSVAVESSKISAVYKALTQTGANDLEAAKVVVAGGRGLKDDAGVALLNQFAEQIGGAVAASRAAVDAGWFDSSVMVGQSGKTIAPDVYIAVGISGIVQHTVGMDQAKCIIAINTDPDAPIFKLADYGILGDAKETLKQLLQKTATVSSS